MSKGKMRIIYAILFLLLLGMEIFIGLFVRDAFVRPYLGDVLVVILIYYLIRIFIPEGVRLLPLYIFLFAVAVELMQLWNVLELLGLAGNRFLRIALGTSYDTKDIICYACGCGLLGIWEFLRYRRSAVQ